MADPGSAVQGFFNTITQNPVYLLLFVGGIALCIVASPSASS